MSRPFDLDQWRPGELAGVAELIDVVAGNLISIKLRPVRCVQQGSQALWLTAHMPKHFYDGWREALRGIPGEKEVDLDVRGYRNGTRVTAKDGSRALIAEHESGPEIILWFMENPAAATAFFGMVAAGLGLAKSSFDVVNSSLGIFKVWLETKKVLLSRLQKETERTRASPTEAGYTVDAVSLEVRTDQRASVLSMTPFPIIDSRQLERFDREAIEHLQAGTEWTGELPRPSAGSQQLESIVQADRNLTQPRR